MPLYEVVVDTNLLMAGPRSRRGASHQVLRLTERGLIRPNVSVALPLGLRFSHTLKRDFAGAARRSVDVLSPGEFLKIVGSAK